VRNLKLSEEVTCDDSVKVIVASLSNKIVLVSMDSLDISLIADVTELVAVVNIEPLFYKRKQRIVRGANQDSKLSKSILWFAMTTT
jgi:hypothetical protein